MRLYFIVYRIPNALFRISETIKLVSSSSIDGSPTESVDNERIMVDKLSIREASPEAYKWN